MKTILVLTACLFSLFINAQIDETKLGKWYMYFFSGEIKDSQIGFQGDIQHRNWNIVGDLEQLLIRGGLTYKPKSANVKFTLGYGNVTSGEFGQGKATKKESRIYQEALIPNQLGRFYLTHRFRFEQRFVEQQDFRTRYRYNLFLNFPLNNKEFVPKTLYVALYNELFINGQKNIGQGNSVEIYDRNRLYGALGYMLKDGLKVQLGIMRQKTESWNKNQLQLSFHHNF